MASAVASKVVPPKPVFHMEILSSPSASGHLFSIGGAAPRSSSDDIKDSSGKDADDGIKDSSGKDADDGIKDSSGKDAAAHRRRERDLPIPKLFTGGVLDVLPEAARRDLLWALEDGAVVFVTGFSQRGWWVSKEDGDAVQLKVAMPGLGKEHVKIWTEKNTLVIKGEGDKDSEGNGVKGPAPYNYRIGLSSQAFKLDQIKAEMKNGLLSLTVPKIKDEERKDVFEIKVE